MKVMVMVKATPNSEAGVLPSTEMMAEMTLFNEELVKAGVMVDGDGLRPSAKGVRIRFDGTRRERLDGPFLPPESLVAGYWIWKVASLEDAVAWAQRCPHPMPGEVAELEIRPFYEADDFGEAFTTELREREERMRAAVAASGETMG